MHPSTYPPSVPQKCRAVREISTGAVSAPSHRRRNKKPPCPGLSRASTSLPEPTPPRKKTWVAGSSPATGHLWWFRNVSAQPLSVPRTALHESRNPVDRHYPARLDTRLRGGDEDAGLKQLPFV